jgi:hypothetical protein
VGRSRCQRIGTDAVQGILELRETADRKETMVQMQFALTRSSVRENATDQQPDRFRHCPNSAFDVILGRW